MMSPSLDSLNKGSYLSLSISPTLSYSQKALSFSHKMTFIYSGMLGFLVGMRIKLAKVWDNDGICKNADLG